MAAAAAKSAGQAPLNTVLGVMNMRIATLLLLFLITAPKALANELQLQTLRGVLGEHSLYHPPKSGLPWLYFYVPSPPKLQGVFHQIEHIVDPFSMKLVTVQSHRTFATHQLCAKHESIVRNILKPILPIEHPYQNWQFSSEDETLVGRLSCSTVLKDVSYSMLRFEVTDLELFELLNARTQPGNAK